MWGNPSVLHICEVHTVRTFVRAGFELILRLTCLIWGGIPTSSPRRTWESEGWWGWSHCLDTWCCSLLVFQQCASKCSVLGRCLPQGLVRSSFLAPSFMCLRGRVSWSLSGKSNAWVALAKVHTFGFTITLKMSKCIVTSRCRGADLVLGTPKSSLKLTI